MTTISCEKGKCAYPPSRQQCVQSNQQGPPIHNVPSGFAYLPNDFFTISTRARARVRVRVRTRVRVKVRVWDRVSVTEDITS